MNTLYLGDCLDVIHENISDMDVIFDAVQRAGKKSKGKITLEV